MQVQLEGDITISVMFEFHVAPKGESMLVVGSTLASSSIASTPLCHSLEGVEVIIMFSMQR